MQDIEIRKVRIGIDEIWHDGGPRRDTPVKKGFIALNLSSRQLVDTEFSSRFMNHVQKARIKPDRLVVEISEESIATWYNEHPEHRHEQHKKGVPA